MLSAVDITVKAIAPDLQDTVGHYDGAASAPNRATATQAHHRGEHSYENGFVGLKRP
jgi:hypothetical protein